MTQQEILNDIKTIIEGQWARDFQIKPGSIHIPFEDEIVPLLISLSLKLKTEEERSFFWGTLQELLEKDFPIIQDGHTSQDEHIRVPQLILREIDKIFIFFVKVNKVDVALNYFDKERNINESFNSVLWALRNLLIQDPHYFDKNTLERLDRSMSRILKQIEVEEYYDKNRFSEREIIAVNGRSIKPIKAGPPKKPRPNYISANQEDRNRCIHTRLELIKKIREMKLDILKKEYKEINKEVNQDRVVLQETISKFNFDKNLNESLNKIDEKLFEAKDKFDLKGCMDLMRSFLEELCKSVALKIHKIKNTPFTQGTVDTMGKACDYLKSRDVDFLSQKEGELLNRLYAFISEESVHTLQSEKEYVRISRNFGIEMGLFLVEKLEKYLS